MPLGQSLGLDGSGKSSLKREDLSSNIKQEDSDVLKKLGED